MKVNVLSRGSSVVPFTDSWPEKTWDDLEKRADEVETQRIKFEISEPRSVTYTNYDNPFDLTEDASGSPHLHRYSGHAWVAVGDIYILECMGKGYIKVTRCVRTSP